MSESESVVYFVQRGGKRGRIKIGTTRNVKARISDLQCAAGVRLRLLCTFPGGRQEESFFHSRFRAFRVGQSEWFRPAAELLDVALGAKPPPMPEPPEPLPLLFPMMEWRATGKTPRGVVHQMYGDNAACGQISGPPMQTDRDVSCIQCQRRSVLGIAPIGIPADAWERR